MRDNQKPASIRAETSREGILTLTIDGRLDAQTTGNVWRETARVVEQASPRRIILDASHVDYCDGSGIGFLMQLQRQQQSRKGEIEIRGLASEFQHLLELFDPREFERTEREEPKRINVFEEAGRATVSIWGDIRNLVTFVGELGAALVSAVLHPRKVRWKDALLTAEQAGVNALPIIGLMGFLIGLIIAFQSAIPMRQFGAEIFVADLVGLSMLRELGPLITAIILAGRTGSAFAAELGTMKVNEEIDALTTMGLDPVRFLVSTRVMAAV
ncbi:MAG: ABC transporter permease, partial [Nitrospiraceae bacterium]